MTGLTISNLVLWVLQISTIVVVVGLARQVGVLHLRLRPLGAGQTGDGPPIGNHYELPPVVSLRGELTPVLVRGHLSLVTFVSPECNTCAPTMQAAGRLRKAERGVRFVVAVDGGQAQGLKYAETYGFRDVVDADSLGALRCGSRPYAVVLSGDGTVLASGVPNTLEQLEMLLAGARRESSARASAAELGGGLPSAGGDAGRPTAGLVLIDSAADMEGSGDHAE